MIRRTTLAAVVLLVGFPLAGCGGDDPFDAYCTVVQDEQESLTRTLDAGGGTTGLIEALPAFERLEAAAPDDIADEWSLFVQAVRGFADAFEAAGVDPATYDATNPPASVSAEQQETIRTAASALLARPVTEAADAVDQQAKDVCETGLSLV